MCVGIKPIPTSCKYNQIIEMIAVSPLKFLPYGEVGIFGTVAAAYAPLLRVEVVDAVAQMIAPAQREAVAGNEAHAAPGISECWPCFPSQVGYGFVDREG